MKFTQTQLDEIVRAVTGQPAVYVLKGWRIYLKQAYLPPEYKKLALHVWLTPDRGDWDRPVRAVIKIINDDVRTSVMLALTCFEDIVQRSKTEKCQHYQP